MNLEQIKQPINAHLEAFETHFKDAMQSRAPLLDKITRYIVKRKGKQIRPLFVFLSAAVCGNINNATHRAGILIELLHTATLVHDDVVDDSLERRGFFSINALWKNKIAVLVGDYLLSKGLLLAIDHQEFTLLKIVSGAVKQMSEGELIQLEKARTLDITEEIYYEIIEHKTASLIASCCASGAASVIEDQDIIDKLSDFGKYCGMAFQIKDDLLDFDASTGKPKGGDIKERKLTLPLIYALQSLSENDRKRIIHKIKKGKYQKALYDEVVLIIKANNGFEYAKLKMNEYINKALAILAPFPDSEAKKALTGLLEFTINRKS